MKIETVQKFEYRIKFLKQMKDDYLFMRDRLSDCQKNAPVGVDLSVQFDRYNSCIDLLDIIIKSYIRKISRR